MLLTAITHHSFSDGVVFCDQAGYYAHEYLQGPNWFLTKTMRVMTLSEAKSHSSIKKSIVRVMTLSEAKSHNTIKKSIVRVMNLTATILLVFNLTLSARSVSQTITFSGKDVPMEKIFSVIEEQTGYVVFGSKDQFNKSDKVTVAVKEMELVKFMQSILAGKPFEFEIKANTIFIRERERVGKEMWIVEEPPIDISGKIVDEDGNPLSGANY